MADLAGSVVRVLTLVGLPPVTPDKSGELSSGFYVTQRPREVVVGWLVSDELTQQVQGLDDMEQPVARFERQARELMLRSMAEALYAAGCVVTLHPDRGNDDARLVVTAGPTR
jgi:hypothetical protein